jgi:hypothetical protein
LEGIDGQRSHFNQVDGFFHPELETSRRALLPISTVETAGDNIHDNDDAPLASEDDLRPFMRLGLEKPTALIIKVLSKAKLDIHTEMNGAKVLVLGDGIKIENHMNTNNEEVLQTQKGDDPPGKLNTRADSICVRRPSINRLTGCRLRI